MMQAKSTPPPIPRPIRLVLVRGGGTGADGFTPGVSGRGWNTEGLMFGKAAEPGCDPGCEAGGESGCDVGRGGGGVGRGGGGGGGGGRFGSAVGQSSPDGVAESTLSSASRL